MEGVLSLATGTLGTLASGICLLITFTAGATGMVSSMAGSVGNALAVLSMDDDYKRKRARDKARRRNAGDHLKYGGEVRHKSIALHSPTTSDLLVVLPRVSAVYSCHPLKVPRPMVQLGSSRLSFRFGKQLTRSRVSVKVSLALLPSPLAV